MLFRLHPARRGRRLVSAVHASSCQARDGDWWSLERRSEDVRKAKKKWSCRESGNGGAVNCGVGSLYSVSPGWIGVPDPEVREEPRGFVTAVPGFLVKKLWGFP